MNNADGPMAKTDMAVASAVTATGAMGISLHDVLELWQLGASATATTLGGAYLIWKWHKDYRWSRRRDRRKADRKDE